MSVLFAAIFAARHKDPTTMLAVFAGFAGLFAVIAVVGMRAAKKRRADLAAVADELGFDFLPDGDAGLQQQLVGLHLFTLGRSRQMRNLLRGRTRDLDVAVFDYQYTTGSGKSSTTHRTTVVSFRADFHLPSFALRPEGFWEKIGAMLAYHDINFDTHPTFSKRYLLRGPDEYAIRDVFTEPVLDYFQDRPGLSVEAYDGALVFYRAGHEVRATDIKKHLEEGFEVFGLFRPKAEG
jgi:hypothetical protein